MTEEKKQEYCPFKRDYPAGDYLIAKTQLEERANKDNFYSRMFKEAKKYIQDKYLEQLDETAINCAVYDFLKEVL